MKPAPGATSRTARRIALAAFLVFAATGGGRIAGSDEVTMFQLSRALMRGSWAVPEGATLRGHDGRFYSKNAAGQAIAAMPFVVAGDFASSVSGLPREKRELASRFVASFFNAAVAAILLGVFYSTARALGVGGAASFAATLLLGFTTPLWPYAKSFMAEPLESLGLLLALGGSARAAGGDGRGVRTAAIGALIAVLAKLVLLPLAALALLPLFARRADGTFVRGWWRPLAALAAALVFHAINNVARFGTPLETGYGAQASGAAYSTPLWVGLYGLLLSSGKGLAWFAPIVWLAPAGFARMRHAAGGEKSPRALAARRAATTTLLVTAVALLLYAGFEHWAGDGSFGPRYLVPLLPLLLLAVAFALEGATRARRRVALLLGAAGLLVQLGGVFIYFGAEMREVGDYPYTLALSDPRFMSDSHFNPRFTPILGHWRMLLRNAGEHARGEAPRLTGAGTPDERLGVSADDQRALLHGIDVWWLYARYAGVPGLPLNAALLLLAISAAWVWRRAGAAVRAEGTAA